MGVMANAGSPGGAPFIDQVQVPEHELALNVIVAAEYGTYTVAVVGGGGLTEMVMVAAHRGSEPSENAAMARRITCIYTTTYRFAPAIGLSSSL